MEIKVKKINGDTYIAKTDMTDIAAIFAELSDTSSNHFILLGEHIEQKMTIESISKVQEG